MEVFTDTPAATLLAPQIDRVAENALTTRNRVIEAVWRLIVGNDTPSPEDGALYVLQDRITSHGPGNMYDFIYKGEHVATVEEVGQWEYKYFLLSNDFSGARLMEIYAELAAEEAAALPA